MNLRRPAAVLAVAVLASCARGAQRNYVSSKRGGYLTEFYDWHRGAYRRHGRSTAEGRVG